MRPRERDDVTASPEPSPPPRIAGTLPSMVVRPSESGGGSDSDAADAVEANQSLDPRRRDSPTPSHHRASSPHFRRRVSPPPFRRRSPPAVRLLGSSPGVLGSPPGVRVRVRGSPPGMHRRGSPPGFPRRYSPPAFRRRGSPLNFNGRFQRFKDVPGYGFNGRSNSPPRRERLDDTRYSPDIDRSAGSHFGRGFRGRGKAGRFREISPIRGRGRGGRSFGRGYNSPGRSLSPVEDVHRHDPNISPREGDWICRNPSCGNLNYAQRSYCSNCNQNRFAPDQSRYSRSPRRGYYNNSPPPYMSPPRIPEPPIDRGRRNTNGYRAPPRLGAADDPRDFRSHSPPLRPGNGFLPYQAQRERVAYRDDNYREERGKFYSPARDEWDSGDRQRDGPPRGRRGYEQRPRSPSPRGRWEHDSRKRSRSPFDEGIVKRPYMSRGRAGRPYSDGYVGRGRDDLDAGRGRGFRRGRGFQRGNDGFAGDRPGMSRGRNNGVY